MDAQGAGTEEAAGLVGRVIGGYRLVRVRGTEETSAVLLGEHVDAPAQRAAIKILRLPQETSATVRGELRAEFARQAQTLFALQHPHILGIYAYGVDVVGGNPYMVLPYPDGGTLAARLASGPLPLPAAAHILAQLADALDAAHALGITHSDLRPTTVLLDEDEQVYLAGIGVPWPIDAAGPGAASNAAYMAPERARGEPASAAADRYSLGVLLYEMVTGFVPFQGATPAIVLLQHAHLPPPPPRALRPDLPETAEAVILRALAKPPEARFASATALAEAFARGLAGESPAEPECLVVETPAQMVETLSIEPDETDSLPPAVAVERAAVSEEANSEPPATESAEQVLAPEDEPALPALSPSTDHRPELGTVQEDDETPPSGNAAGRDHDEERGAVLSAMLPDGHASTENSADAGPPQAPEPPHDAPRDAPRSVPVVTRRAVAEESTGERRVVDRREPESPALTAHHDVSQATEQSLPRPDVTASSDTSATASAASDRGVGDTVSPLMVRNVMLALFALVVGGAAIAVLRFLGVAEFALMAVIIGLFVWLGVLLPRRWEGAVKGHSVVATQPGRLSPAPSR